MSVSQNTVLFVDDDSAAINAIAQSLHRRDYAFDTFYAANEPEALRLLLQQHPEAVVLDLSLDSDHGPAGGLELLEKIQREDPTVRIMILTGHDGKQYGVESLRRGAASFLAKPVDADHLGVLLRDAVNSTLLKRSYLQLASTPQSLETLTGLSSRNAEMVKVIESVAYAASNNQPLLIAGETGTGKGVIAQAIHRASSRKSRPFIRVQPRFGSHDLTASEIFGHERGAFTGATENRRGLLEEANGGTLFLDEVDEFPLETQILLLHALQEKTFRRLGSNRELRSDFRLLAATNRPLQEIVREGKIRPDFYHRVAHFTIRIPPLRDRIEDIPELAQAHLQSMLNRENLDVCSIAPEAMEKLLRFGWPGNVRELFAVVESGAYRAQYERRHYIQSADLLIDSSPSSGSVFSEGPGSFREQVRSFEIRLIKETLVKCSNNQSQAAERLKVDRSTVRRLLNRRSDIP